MSGGLPAAAFGGPAALMAPPRPGRPGLPGGHAVREPGRGRRRAWPRCAPPTTPSTRRSTRNARPARRADRRRADAPRACRHRVQFAGNMVVGVLHRRARCTTTPGAQAAQTWRFPPFFHALLDRGVYPPPSAFEAWFVSDGAGRRRLADDRGRPAARRGRAPPPRAARRAARTARAVTGPGTDPHRRAPAPPRRGVQPGRHPLRPAARVPALARTVATRPTSSPKALADADLDRRARLAAAAGAGDRRRRSPTQHGLEIVTDDRLIEADNSFEGQRVAVGDGALRNPRYWWRLRDPFTPSWGEPYLEIAHRMLGAVHRARELAAGHEALCVSPPAADLDAAAVRHRPAAVARPAPPPVRARLADLARVRRRRARAGALHRARRRSDPTQTGA